MTLNEVAANAESIIRGIQKELATYAGGMTLRASVWLMADGRIESYMQPGDCCPDEPAVQLWESTSTYWATWDEALGVPAPGEVDGVDDDDRLDGAIDADWDTVRETFREKVADAIAELHELAA